MPRTPFHRLRAEPLEDRTTPAVAVALSGSNLLVFDTASPVVTTTVPVTGVTAGETLAGVDFRPQNGLLYGLGVNPSTDIATLYAISTRTGVAGVVGSPGAIGFTPNGTVPTQLPDPAAIGYGFDFNPATDRIRVVAGSLNFRVDPNTGTGVDGDNTGASSGAVTGTNPDGAITGVTNLDGAAYTNNRPNNGNVTTLYALDSVTDSLYRLTNPNAGTTALVGSLTLNGGPFGFGALGGFDIPAGVDAAAPNAAVASGSGFAVLRVNGSAGLYRIDLTTAQATFLGTVGSGSLPVSGFAVQSDPGGFPAVALSADGKSLVRFNTATPGTTTTAFINGILAGDKLVALDMRPQTGQLYAMGVNFIADAVNLYLVSPQTLVAGVDTASATPVPMSSIPFARDLAATDGYGFDFDPTTDQIRITIDTLTDPNVGGINLHVRPDGTNLSLDTFVNGSGSSGVGAAAYTNSFGQATTGGNPTTLYTLDSTLDRLFVQNTPNSGTQTLGQPVTLDGVPLDFTAAAGFDIPPSVRVAASGAVAAGRGFALLTVGGVTGLYAIDLSTGAATLLGNAAAALAGGSGLAVGDAPAGAVSFAAPAVAVSEAAGAAVLTLTRTGGSAGPVTVTLAVTGGTAAAVSDIGPVPPAVTFADGQTTATVTIPIVNDGRVEPDETIALALVAPSNGGVLGAPAAATVTILDDDVAGANATSVSGRPDGSAQLFTLSTGGAGATLSPFPGFLGAVRTARGDVDGDRIADTILVTGPGVPIRVAVVSGGDNVTVLVAPFDPFGGDFLGGGFVAAADLDGDHLAEFVVTPDRGGGPRVSIFSLVNGAAAVRGNFLGIDDANFRGGCRAALGDVNRDGTPDVAVSAGFLGGPRTALFDGTTVLAAPARLVGDFFAFPGSDATTLRNGVFVAAGDVDGDGFADLIFGGGPGGAPRVFILSGALVTAGDVAGAQAAPVANFFVAGNSADRGGVRPAVKFADGDTKADVVVGSGEGSRAGVRVYLGMDFTGPGEPAAAQDISPFGGAVLADGVFVG